MIKRNEIRRTAIWILDKISKEQIISIEEGTDEDFREGNQSVLKHRRDYRYFSIKQIKETSNGLYEFSDLYPAIDLLAHRGHIEFSPNKTLYNNSLLICTLEGSIALLDEFYQDDIKQYENDRIFLRLRWQLPLIALVLSLASTGISFYQLITAKKDIQALKERLYVLEQAQQINTKKEIEKKVDTATGTSSTHRDSAGQ